MWMIVTDDITNRLSRFPIRIVGRVPVTIHSIENSTLNWFEAITNVWQSPVLNDVLGITTKAITNHIREA